MNPITQKIGKLFREMVSADLRRRLDSSTDVFLLIFNKIRSADMTQLRKDLKAAGASVLVTKNSFMRKAFLEAKKSDATIALLDGPMAFVFIKDDPIAASKVLMNFVKAHEAMTIRGGFMAERTVTLDDIKTISKIPGRQALYGQVASVLNAPIGKLATGLNQIVVKLAYALNAVRDKKK